eukprot:Gb_07395 [translate_table: standard]
MRTWWTSEDDEISFDWFGSVSYDHRLIERLLELTDVGGGAVASNKFGPHRTNGKGANSAPGNWAG